MRNTHVWRGICEAGSAPRVSPPVGAPHTESPRVRARNAAASTLMPHHVTPSHHRPPTRVRASTLSRTCTHTHARARARTHTHTHGAWWDKWLVARRPSNELEDLAGARNGRGPPARTELCVQRRQLAELNIWRDKCVM